MKITVIKQQIQVENRYSIFIDGDYSFSLSGESLLDAKIAVGDEVSTQQIEDFKALSSEDKLYGLALRYVALRPRSSFELKQYLEKKHSPAPLIEQITNKLIRLGLLDDKKYAQSFVNDRRLLRPTSRRKIMIELRSKHLSEDIIEAAVGKEEAAEQTALADIISRKRKQSRYQDDLKLMQYLARQGFNYADIKAAMQPEK